jgi:hypothetical protein
MRWWFAWVCMPSHRGWDSRGGRNGVIGLCVQVGLGFVLIFKSSVPIKASRHACHCTGWIAGHGHSRYHRHKGRFAGRCHCPALRVGWRMKGSRRRIVGTIVDHSFGRGAIGTHSRRSVVHVVAERKRRCGYRRVYAVMIHGCVSIVGRGCISLRICLSCRLQHCSFL